MLWWIIATVLAFFVKGLCGFANTLVFTTMLSFAQDNLMISPVELLLGYPGNAILAWKERKSINWRMCLPLCVLVLVGCIPGAALLMYVDAIRIRFFFGAVIVLIALEMLFRNGARGRQSKLLMTGVGVLSGVLCGIFGVGALLGAYMSRVTQDTSSFKGNLCMVFFVENTFRVFVYVTSGIITMEAFHLAFNLGPAMLAGLVLGMRTSRRSNEQTSKKVVLAALMISGFALMLTSM